MEQQPQLNGKVENPNLKLGIIIVVVAIVLIILAVCTDFYGGDKTLFGHVSSGDSSGDKPKNSGDVDPVVIDPKSETLEVYFFDVGQADCTLVRIGDKTMLIDAGNNPDGKLISRFLRNDLSIKKIDYLIGTHAHEDHIGGMDIIIEDFEIGNFYLPVQKADSKSYNDVIEWAQKKNLKIINPNVGDTFELGSAICEFMAQDRNTEDLNESSIVLELTFKEKKFLFTADILSSNEEARNWNDVDVLKVAHHGSTYSSSASFLRETLPEYAVISCGRDNDYYYPHEAVLKRLEDVGCENVFVTSRDNTIYMVYDGNQLIGYKLQTILDGNT